MVARKGRVRMTFPLKGPQKVPRISKDSGNMGIRRVRRKQKQKRRKEERIRGKRVGDPGRMTSVQVRAGGGGKGRKNRQGMENSLRGAHLPAQSGTQWVWEKKRQGTDKTALRLRRIRLTGIWRQEHVGVKRLRG